MKFLQSIFKRLTGFYGAVITIAFILLTLSITNGIPGLGLVINDNSRILAAACSVVIAVIAMVLYHFSEDEKPEAPLKDDALSTTQKNILKVIKNEYMLHGTVSQDFIEKNEYCDSNNIVKRINPDELYYRLECLVLNNYLIKSPTAFDDTRYRFTYKLSDQYRKREKIAKVEITTNYEPKPVPA